VVKCEGDIVELESGLEGFRMQGWFSFFCGPFSLSNEEPGVLRPIGDDEKGWNTETTEAAVIFEKDGIPYINDDISLANEGTMTGLDGDFARLVDSVLGGRSGRRPR